MYLVDTNVLSEARRRNPIALDWMDSVAADRVFLSVITIGEITRGIVAKHRTDSASAAKFAEWLLWVRSSFNGRILPITDKIAVEWGRISAGRTRGEADALIAATAIAHELIIVTRNTKDFVDTGATVLDPWIG